MTADRTWLHETPEPEFSWYAESLAAYDSDGGEEG